MFDSELKYRVRRLEDLIYKDSETYWDAKLQDYVTQLRPGLAEDVKNLKKENEKLKAIVAELCDYIYGDKT